MQKTRTVLLGDGLYIGRVGERSAQLHLAASERRLTSQNFCPLFD